MQAPGCMALETEEPSLGYAPQPELVDFPLRWWVSAALAVPLLILTMRTEFLGLHRVEPAYSPSIQFVLTAPIVLWAGWPFFTRRWASIVTRKLNMFTLIVIGVGAAFLYSVVATVAPGLFSPTFRIHGTTVFVINWWASASRWYYSVKCLNCGRGLQRAKRFVHCSALRQRPRCGSTPMALKPRFRLPKFRPATACAFGPARRFPWTASSSKAAHRSTNRCLPACLCPLPRKRPAR